MTPEQAGTVRSLAGLLATARVRVYATKTRIMLNNETPENTELRRQRAQKAFDEYLDSLTISQGGPTVSQVGPKRRAARRQRFDVMRITLRLMGSSVADTSLTPPKNFAPKGHQLKYLEGFIADMRKTK